MSPDLVLHIGANKTGSSAIQNFLSRNCGTFRELGFQIPDHTLAWSNLVSGAHVFSLQSIMNGPDPVDRMTEAFDTLMSNRPASIPVLISAENLSNSGNWRFFERVCERYRTKIILYVRRQDDLLASSWQQWHSKRITDFSAWLIRALPSIGHWGSVIDGWESVAGENTVTVRIFEREEFPDGNVLNDFLAALGIAPSDGQFDFAGEIVNPTYSEFITPLVAGNGAVFKDPHDNLFYELVGSLTGDFYIKGRKYSILSRGERTSILAFFEEENQRVCKKHFPNRKLLFRPIDHSKYIYLDESEAKHEQLRFLAHMVFELTKRVRTLEAEAGGSAGTVKSSAQPRPKKEGAKRAWWGK